MQLNLDSNADGNPTSLRRQSSTELPRAAPLTPRLAKRPVARSPRPAPQSPTKTPGSHKVASQSLRDTIAKARAAHKAQRPGSVESGSGLDAFNFGTDDPFNQGLFGGKKVILQRVKQARFEGKLNISAMQLTEIPDEVYKMYETTGSDQDDDDGPKWYESVDLTKMLLADNELKEIGEELAQQFGAVASIDVSGLVTQKRWSTLVANLDTAAQQFAGEPAFKLWDLDGVVCVEPGKSADNLETWKLVF